jgi:hypothetical protein
MLKTGVAAVVATAFVLALLPSTLFAATADDAVSPAAVCIECCEGDAVCQALASLAELRITVETTVPDRGIANSLEVKVDAATASVLAGRYGTALKHLDAFGNEVSAKGSANPPPDWSKFVQALHEITKGIVANLRV